MPTLQEINNRIHSIPTPSELESSLSSIKSDIETVLSQPDDGFNENYYKNHTGRELFRKLNNFGLSSLIFDNYDSGFRPTTIDGVSFISLVADNSTTPSYTFESSGLNTTIKLKIFGDSGEFLTIQESNDSINFRLTIGGTESDPTLTLNDGASNFGTLSEGQSTTYTLSDNSVLTFLFDSLGGIILHITKSISEDTGLQIITTTNTESQILSSDPVDYTIEQASDTYNLFVRYNDMWFKYEPDTQI